jgi:hypothetical protein
MESAAILAAQNVKTYFPKKLLIKVSLYTYTTRAVYAKGFAYTAGTLCDIGAELFKIIL